MSKNIKLGDIVTICGNAKWHGILGTFGGYIDDEDCTVWIMGDFEQQVKIKHVIKANLGPTSSKLQRHTPKNEEELEKWKKYKK